MSLQMAGIIEVSIKPVGVLAVDNAPAHAFGLANVRIGDFLDRWLAEVDGG
ncbi:hypothetical protein [Archangium lipolyticum]|uniref:hypothetical protein n=1 Tax=Archangium lipolyticum TaxID=2970465 RepID=UPI00214A79B7|nr:hypothetical protein [Archangium lipolyticum]